MSLIFDEHVDRSSFRISVADVKDAISLYRDHESQNTIHWLSVQSASMVGCPIFARLGRWLDGIMAVSKAGVVGMNCLMRSANCLFISICCLHFHHQLEGVGGGRCIGRWNHLGCAFILGHNGGLTTDI